MKRQQLKEPLTDYTKCDAFHLKAKQSINIDFDIFILIKFLLLNYIKKYTTLNKVFK